MIFGSRTKNNRIYFREDVEEAFNEIKDKIETSGILYGELGYPDTFDINVNNAISIIQNLEIDSKGIYGDIKLLHTRSSKILIEKYVRDLKINNIIDGDELPEYINYKNYNINDEKILNWIFENYLARPRGSGITYLDEKLNCMRVRNYKIYTFDLITNEENTMIDYLSIRNNNLNKIING